MKPSNSDFNAVPKAILDRLSKAFGPQVVALGAIGSAARSVARLPMTDLDIYIVLDDGDRTRSTAWAELYVLYEGRQDARYSHEKRPFQK